MAWNTKYRLEIADNLGIIWTVDISEQDFPGEITTLTGSGDPINIEYFGDDDIFNQNITGSEATINVISNTDFALAELFTSNGMQFKVTIKQGSSVYWGGFIIANNYKEPYDCVPYPVSLTATDGLGLLKDFKFVDLDYSARTNASVIIFDILSLIGATSFTEFVNVYESTMSDTVNNSPFDQFRIDPDLFLTDDCYKALEEILKTFSAGIRQENGQFVIYRFKELKDATMYGRTFTSGTTKTSTTKTPAQYLNRTGQASNFRDHEGGTMTMVPQLKTIILNQDFGFRKSIYKNYDFPYEAFIHLGMLSWDLDKWTKLTGTTIGPSCMLNAGDGLFITNTTHDATHGVSQTVNIVATSDSCVLEIETAQSLYSGGGVTCYNFARLINSDGVNTKYFNGSAWVDYTNFAASVISLNTGQATRKEPNFMNFVFNLPPIPYTGTLTIELRDASVSPTSIFSLYKKAHLYFVPFDGRIVEGIGYTVENETSGQIIEVEYLLGDGYGFDNDHLQYKGCISVGNGPASMSWHTRGNTENDPLIELIGGELGNQFSRPKQLLDIPVMETSSNSFLSIIGNLQDTLNTYSGNNRIFAFAHGNYNVKMRTWDRLSVNEII